MSVKYSVLDLATVVQGATAAETFQKSKELAIQADELGFTRYWFAEHHNMIGVASSAPQILIGYIAGHTKNIRVGSGGIMLPNHAPLVVAEQFGTLASLYPGRIDLGLGRAPGTDQVTAMAIRGENMMVPNDFASDVQRLQNFFSAENIGSKVRAHPGEGLDIPIWILGSSTDSAHLAAELGLPYAFASHFAPAYFTEAIGIYRKNFKPSAQLAEPYVIACVNVVAADTNAEAKRLFSSLQLFFKGVITGKREQLQPPVDNIDEHWSAYEAAATQQMLAYAFIGGPQTLQRKLQEFITETQINEVMATLHIYDHHAKLHSYRLFAEAMS